MGYVGIDGHNNQRQRCLLSEAGEVVHQRIWTHRAWFAVGFAERPKARLSIEALTKSSWVAHCAPITVVGHR